MKFSSFPISAVLFFTLISTADALVTYDSDAFSTFTLLDSGGMGISISLPPEPASMTTTGTGLASIDADSQIEAPPGLFTMTSEVSGSADAPFGTSTSTVLNGLFIELDNLAGAAAATAIFEFSYSWFAEVTRTEPDNELGFASPFFHITGLAPSGTETLMIDDGTGVGPVPVADWLVHPVAELSLLGGADLSATETGAETVLAYVTVPAFSFDAFSVITDSSGVAVHIPEPGSLALLAMGLVGFGIARRRRLI